MEHPFIDQNRTAPALFEMDLREVQTLTRLLSKVIAGVGPHSGTPVSPERVQKVALAEAYYRFRRKRERIADETFGKGLFVDPAWDILLDLYIQAGRGVDVNVSSACLASIAPPTTALRYIAELEGRGIISRTPTARDARLLIVQLTERGCAMVEKIIDQMPFPRVDHLRTLPSI